MEDTEEKKKIEEARYLILIPLVITAICLWLDLWTSYAGGAYDNGTNDICKEDRVGTFILQGEKENAIAVYSSHNDINWIDNVTVIIRCGMGYLFPSLISIVIAMIWQQISSLEKPYGVPKEKIGWSLFSTVGYSTIFITCLIKYNIWTALVAVLASVAYIWYVYNFCLDERIKPKKKSQMTNDELLLQYLNRKQGGYKNENDQI